MNKLLLQIFMFTLLCSTAWAQTRSITGKVTDKSGEPLVGVTVMLKGTSQGVSTDVAGIFKINVPTTGNPVLVLRYIGFENQEVAVGSQTQLNITLQQNAATNLNEVQVVNIGYGTVSKNALTGSVSSVNAKQLKDIPINSTAEALAGRLAGVQITQSEGSPNTTASVKVRGGGSITLENTPLYVVDGVQVENALSVLAPQDIESIDVLKDAASTAIYGARGGNGVVLITTKGGSRSQKPTISYNGLVGFRKLNNKLDVMNPYDFVKYQYERALLNGAQELNTFTGAYGFYNDLELYKEAPFVDWQKQMFGRNALMQTHNLSLTGGNENTRYALSVTSNGEEGVQLISDFNRKIINFKFDQKINDKLSANFTVRYNNTIVNGAGTSDPGSSSNNRLRQTVKYRPLLTGGRDLDDYDPDYASQTNANSLSLVNPILLNQAEYRRNYQNTANFSGSVTYNINKIVSFKTTFGYDYSSTRANAFNDTITSIARQNANMPTASIATTTRGTINNSNVFTLNFDKSGWGFSKRNSLNVLLGQELYDDNLKSYTIESRFFPVGISADRALGNFSLGVVPAGSVGLTQPLPVSSEIPNRVFSFFGRISYSFDKKYLLNLSMRGDGSSKFAQGYKWGYFPAGSFAWRVSDEKFFSKLKNTFNDVKLRVNYGQSANNRVPNFLYLTQFVGTPTNNTYSINDQLVVGFGPSALAYNSLTWETTTAKGLGLDFSVFNNRLQVTADVYSNKITNLLFPLQLPAQTGYQEQIRNIGSTQNKGVELQLNATPISNKNFSWTINYNISYNKNKILSLGGITTSRLYSSGWAGSNQPSDYITKVGQSVGTIWGLETDGYYKVDDFNYANGVYTLKAGIPNNQSVTSTAPQPGVIKFKDLDGNNIIDDKDRTIIGDAQPKFFGGFNQQFTYKNFDLSIFLNYQLGNDILNANKLEFTSGYTPNSNLLSIMNGRWRNVNDQGQRVTDPAALTALNTNATIWSPLTTASSFYVHSWAVESGSFLRINNLTLGYTLSPKLLSKIHVSRLRVYGTVNNLAVITGYSGYDPEVNTRRNSPVTPGVDYAAYPRSRAFIMGVNLSL
ncbi:SusC/RagA family TonB-linked outer membrane protein [Mucilaginibacter terrae]|uniref:TonB-linked SusC/RagA family outer membrane protein n=1 Tax=Mucilaginibacter terrae TaxID=1955052 RepID=A0ABU3GNT2_9SPHI|nr:TonB-dependent receptor [Mucilaginibacter terrae]MDT3401447.1 TonB-linked SusC/RagA family outer membrane protein [Mucilaginibacter terrae]